MDRKEVNIRVCVVSLFTLLQLGINVCDDYLPSLLIHSYQILIAVLTFCCYATYHLTRKTISVVKVKAHILYEEQELSTCSICKISPAHSHMQCGDIQPKQQHQSVKYYYLAYKN